MSVLLLLLLTQLKFVEQRPTPLLPPELQPPTCEWGPAKIWCQLGCDCLEVTKRLELAKSEISSHWMDSPADWWAGLNGWKIFVSKEKQLPGPNGEVLYGVTIGEERRMVLTSDMRAALHELIHVQDIASGSASLRSGLYDHPLWDRNGAIREICDRFSLRFRNRPP